MKSLLCTITILASLAFYGWNAQAQSANVTSASVPRLVNFAGTAADANNKPMTGVLGVTFALYREQQGGAPLWLETQNPQADKTGHYTVQLGASKPDGIPADLFASGEARWLGIQISGQLEQPRVLLLSVPYALKAADAETLGGLPASAFLLASQAAAQPANIVHENANSASASTLPPVSTDVTTTGGTANTLPLFTTATSVQSSAISQTGSGATARIGIGTATPSATFDVRGTTALHGNLSLPPSGTATATAGKNSPAQTFIASVYNSTVGAAASQNFRWQAEPANNNTANAGGTLNLLFGTGSTTPAETGLKIASNGQLTFAAGQKFPGTGDGTITAVTAGSGLSGGGTAGGVSLSLLTSCSGGQVLQWNGTAWACSASGLGSVSHNATLTGNGASTTPLGITVPMSLSANSGAAIIAGTNTGSGPGVMGQVGNSFPGVMGVNTGTGHGVQGSVPGTAPGTGGVFGFAGSPSGMITIPAAGVRGDSKSLTGVIGTSLTGAGVMGTGAVGVLGQVTSSSPGVMGTNTGTGNGVQGSISGTITGAGGVYGISGNVSGIAQPAAGVVGDSQNQYGVLGKSSSTAGVVGVSTEASGVVGQVANNFPGVQGNNTSGGSGVQGISTNGAGVYGGSTNGFGMVTNTNVQQARGGGGWVKAMVFVAQDSNGNYGISRCYNSQASGSTVNTPPCGITFTHEALGSTLLDFGFTVSDRFLSASTVFTPGDGGAVGTEICLSTIACTGLTSTQISVATFYISTTLPTDNPFFVFVY